ncbi:pirin [Corynebacterium phocae]|uniref:Pirin n=1 Tax=Corynebacterium phocae TaxID=161895 RepID=A0A1L7D1T7_9CORY|nr:pirin family protein [Corynebacterium phocae]APT92037.1 pirin [Corynebacterium phocae]KAA8726419.1 pirin family protein [Corynebacterium phocae]
MSNPEENPQETNLRPRAASCHNGAKVEILTSRDVPLGGPRAMTVKRTLPQRQRSMIGAWCFVDHYGPDNVATTGGMDVAPHPHIGLQTVSWLFEGAITHHDAAGFHAVVLPGEVNLMTAGNGICHSEVSTQDTTVLHGVQLWLAQPDPARHGGRNFENYRPQRHEFPSDSGSSGGSALVFLGQLLGQKSPVKTYTPVVGAEINLNPGSSLNLAVNPDFEHGILLDEGTLEVEGIGVNRTEIAYLGVAEKSIHLHNPGDTPARMLVIGGTPFGEEIVMWWNFVGRSYQDIEQARADWEAHSPRFGKVLGYIGRTPDSPVRLPSPELPNASIKPRKNPDPVARAGQGR